MIPVGPVGPFWICPEYVLVLVNRIFQVDPSRLVSVVKTSTEPLAELNVKVGS